MTKNTESRQAQRFCRACGTPAGEGQLCQHCGQVLQLPDPAGLVEDEGAAARRVFEGRDEQPHSPKTPQ